MSIDEISNTAANLEAMGMAAATTYYDLAVKYGITKYPKGGVCKSRNWNRFMQIARMCESQRIPVEAFVTGAFLHTMESHPFVTVADICKVRPDNLAGSKESSGGEANPQDLWNLLSCKLLDMVFAIDGIKSKTDLLDNAMYGFPAWFRVFSTEKPCEDIIVHWGDLAYEELMDNLTLLEYIKKKRPATFKLLQRVIKKI